LVVERNCAGTRAMDPVVTYSSVPNGDSGREASPYAPSNAKEETSVPGTMPVGLEGSPCLTRQPADREASETLEGDARL
jgi:hypothetical protein